MSSEHTAGSFSDNEWTAFWRENGKQVTNYESIFKGTIRSFEWKGQYSNYILSRQLERAPAGTLKVHEFRQSKGESYEPKPELLQGRTGPEAMTEALRLFDLAW
jgi:hypothetical protein